MPITLVPVSGKLASTTLPLGLLVLARKQVGELAYHRIDAADNRQLDHPALGDFEQLAHQHVAASANPASMR